MALQFNHTLSNSTLVAPTAYARISMLGLSKERKKKVDPATAGTENPVLIVSNMEQIEIRVEIYASSADRNSPNASCLECICICVCAHDAAFSTHFPNGIETANIHAAAYAYLKSQNKFAGATDV